MSEIARPLTVPVPVSRIGIGCMRLSTDPEVNSAQAAAAISAALDAGFTLFDTARAYAPNDGDPGHNERLLARALKSHPRGKSTTVVTKCGMRREGVAWIPDGRASAIAADVAASHEALDGIPIDILLLHAPDPRVSLSTMARTLARILDSGMVRRVGVSNVSRKQLEEINSQVRVTSVEMALGAFEDLPIRSGVLSYCIEQQIQILAHAPFGGPERVQRLIRDPALSAIARRRNGVTGADVFLAYLLAVRPEIIPIVGVRRPETVVHIAAAASLQLEDEDLLKLDSRFHALGTLRRPLRAAPSPNVEIVMLMGVAGAGKSRAALEYVAQGYERLNRDTLGGSLRGIAQRLDTRLAAGGERFVLDNTYVTRALRSDVLQVAARYGAPVRCSYFATPLHEAQINVVQRMLERLGRVLTPEEISVMARREPAALAPRVPSRMTRELEVPALDEGFCEITTVPFVRERRERGRQAIVAPLAALQTQTTPFESALQRLLDASPAHAPCLLFAWSPDADEFPLASLRNIVQNVARATGRTIEIAICVHPAGPPICWCRPPLPGLFMSFAHRHGIDLTASVLYSSNSKDQTLARVLGMSLQPYPFNGLSDDGNLRARAQQKQQ